MKTTQVERAALSKILMTLGVSAGQAEEILEKLHVDRREWSDDVTDARRCVGQFVHFFATDELPLASYVTHGSVWTSHSGAPGGVDFVLFLESNVPQFLEIGSFGFPVLKTMFDGASSEFAFQA